MSRTGGHIAGCGGHYAPPTWRYPSTSGGVGGLKEIVLVTPVPHADTLLRSPPLPSLKRTLAHLPSHRVSFTVPVTFVTRPRLLQCKVHTADPPGAVALIVLVLFFAQLAIAPGSDGEPSAIVWPIPLAEVSGNTATSSLGAGDVSDVSNDPCAADATPVPNVNVAANAAAVIPMNLRNSVPFLVASSLYSGTLTVI